MSSMGFLFSAYFAIWVILAIFMFSIHSREKRLRSEVERLKQLIESKNRKL